MIKQFEITKLAQYLPPGIEFDQVIGGQLVATTKPNSTPVVQLDLQVPPSSLVFDADGREVQAKIAHSTVTAKLANDNLRTEAKLNLGSIGSAVLNAAVTQLSKQQKLTGSLQANVADLSLLSALVPNLQAASGKVSVDTALAGTLANPQPYGDIRLEEFSVELPEVAVKLTDGQFHASSRNGPFTISGSARSGEGTLQLSGRAAPVKRELTLKLNGENFTVANSRRLQVVISPQLEIKMAGKETSVHGEITVPKAFAKIGGGVGTVKSSSDVVFVDEDSVQQSAAPPSQVDLGVKVVLGDKVELEAADFHGMLTGNLAIEQKPGRVPTGSGTIEVIDGGYYVYGQKLNMERGRVLFGGGPLDNPQLDMDVYRDVPAYEVKAGARIRGTAKLPAIEWYSEPAMTEANILSYIVLGRPLSGNGASITLEKFLTPELYISYGIGLFETAHTFNMRYKLSDRLTLQAASAASAASQKSSADLVYTIER